MKFKALQVINVNQKYQTTVKELTLDDLSPGEVVIDVDFSSLNYKDALAITGAGKILRRFPLIPGIDMSGTVHSSADSRFKVGDSVLVTGCGLGESHDGGFSQVVRVPGDWVVSLPSGLNAKEAMILGTAGFTSALAIHRLEQNGQVPQAGDIIVTGASGGVGSFAVNMLNQLGYSVVAISGKEKQHAQLKKWGASQVLKPTDLDLGTRPLEAARWAGAIDNVGGEILSGLSRHIKLWGNIACIGLAGGADLHTTVMPLILRGVSLLGISSANCPMPLRKKLWQRLANDLKPNNLEEILYQEITLEQIPEASHALLNRELYGRTIVRF